MFICMYTDDFHICKSSVHRIAWRIAISKSNSSHFLGGDLKDLQIGNRPFNVDISCIVDIHVLKARKYIAIHIHIYIYIHLQRTKPHNIASPLIPPQLVLTPDQRRRSFKRFLRLENATRIGRG